MRKANFLLGEDTSKKQSEYTSIYSAAKGERRPPCVPGGKDKFHLGDVKAVMESSTASAYTPKELTAEDWEERGKLKEVTKALRKSNFLMGEDEWTTMSASMQQQAEASSAAPEDVSANRARAKAIKMKMHTAHYTLGKETSTWAPESTTHFSAVPDPAGVVAGVREAAAANSTRSNSVVLGDDKVSYGTSAQDVQTATGATLEYHSLKNRRF
jgi:hypothetical protein